MSAPLKIQKVFRELRFSLGEEGSDEQLLEMAHIMVVKPDMVQSPKTGMNGGCPFVERPLNEVMERFPWRLVTQEWTESDDFLVEEPVEILLDRYIGQAA